MKKFLAITAGVALAMCSFVSLSACKKETAKGVVLTEVSSDDIGRVNGIDYYVVPEPAATAKVKALTSAGSAHYNVGNVQSLYGEGGYPQAVIVAKNSLIENDGKFVSEFITKFSQTSQWLQTVTDYSSIVSKITSAGGTSLKAPMLSATVIQNCNINYVSAVEEKQNILNYMNSVNAINPNMYGECADEFFLDATTISQSETTSKTSVSVYMPDGAPALAMAYMMSGEGETLSKELNFNVVASTAINSTVTNADENQNADICIIPVNASAKVLGSGQRYKLLGTVTHGNFFIISSNQTQLTAENFASALEGKKIGVVNLSAVPGLTFKMVLNKYNVSYTQENQ
ncbi:MAG: hypothetical protein ACI4MS_04035 [Candidatus Coproplasma sp.]